LGIATPKNKWLDIQNYINTKSEKLSQSPPIKIKFYIIAYKHFKKHTPSKFGQIKNDPNNGFIYFLKPGDVYDWVDEGDWEGFHIAFHDDLLKDYTNFIFNFFSYSTKEALFLTNEEEQEVISVFNQTHREYNKTNFSTNLILAYCNVLLTLIEKYYTRQFDSRKTKYNQLVQEFETHLKNTLSKDIIKTPTVSEFAEKLFITPNYLSDVLKEYTGKTALEWIHIELIELARDKLLNSTSSISEIAYELGFEYPTYFSKLFKQKVGKSPSEYRNP